MKPVKVAVASFAGLTLAALAAGLAARWSLIEPATARRAIGIILGLMAIVTGNFVPKLRPLSAPGSDARKAAAAEWFAGWTLVIAGIGCVALFALLPLSQARFCAGLLSLGAISAIAWSWAGLVRKAFAGPATEKRQTMAYLLVSFLYVFANAAVAYLFDAPWARELASWMLVAYSFLFAIFFAIANHKKRSNSCLPGA
jgi:hypothetical protein